MTQVTVVISLYNKAPYVQRAIQSVLEQTFKDFEVIVIDDGSTDGGAKVVSAFGDSRIRLIQQENAGESAARNRGIREASVELVAFLDADDEWLPDFLTTIVALRETFPQAGLYGTGFLSLHKDGTYEDFTLYCQEPMHLIDNYFTRALRGPYFCSSSCAVPRTVFDAVGYFAEGEPMDADDDMWARIALRFPVAYAERAFALYHQESEGRTTTAHALHFPLPLFVRTMRQDGMVSQIPYGDETAVMAYCNYRLIHHAKHLIRVGFAAEARRIVRQEFFKVPREQMEEIGVLLASYGMPMSLMRLAKRIIRACICRYGP